MTIHKKLETLANMAIIVVACLLGTVIVRNYLLTPRSTQAANQSTTKFEQLSSIGVNWQQSKQTLVLALSTQCHYCTDSAPFYRQVVSAPRTTRLLALLPQPIAESREYLNRLGVSVDDIKQVQFSTINITGTPTLLLIDENGFVRKSWIGKLGEDQQAEVLKEIS